MLIYKKTVYSWKNSFSVRRSIKRSNTVINHSISRSISVFVSLMLNC